MLGALLGLGGLFGGGAAATGAATAGAALAGKQLLSSLIPRPRGMSRVADVLAPSTSSGVMDAINQYGGKSLMGAGKDFLIGDDPLKTFFGTAKPGTSQGVIPAALGSFGVGYQRSDGARIGPIRPLGPSGLLGGFNRSLQKQSRPVRVMRSEDQNPVLRGYSNALGGFSYA